MNKKYLVLLVVCLFLVALMTGCNMQLNNPIGGLLDGITRQLSGISESLSRMVENITRGIRFGP